LAARHWSWQNAENERSLHKGYILVGGGSVIMAITLLTWCSYIETFDSLIITLLISALLLATISWIDDIATLASETVQVGVRCCRRDVSGDYP